MNWQQNYITQKMSVPLGKKCSAHAKNSVYTETKNPSFLSHQETLHQTTFIDLTRIA